MKTTHKTKKKSSSSHKQHRAQAKVESDHNSLEKVNSDVKNWGTTISKRFLSNYALPFTRLVEAKLISLQSKV